MVRIPAKAHVLHAMSSQAMPWKTALAELVDNSLDAGAFRVTIEATARTIVVTDDGRGAEDILSLFTVGEHKRQSSTRLGVYGIGAKDAWLSCADIMKVETIRNSIKTSLQVDYNDLINNDWNTREEPQSEPCNLPSGTKITLPLRAGKNLPSLDAFSDLAFTFTPAIQAGKQIFRQLKGSRIPLSAHVMPLRDDVVKSEFEVDGKHVAIDIGILPEGVSFRGPLWLIYGHRIIDKTSLGTGQYLSSRIGGSITLGKGWRLSKNKDTLANDEERLQDAIFVRIEHILKKAESLAESVESLQFLNELQSMLNASISEANKREKRSKGDSTGTRTPAATGRKRTRAQKVTDNPGSVEATIAGRRRGFLIDYCDDDEKKIGRFESRTCKVSLNNKHPFVQANKGKNHLALLVVAASLIADSQCRNDENGKRLLGFAFSDFSEALGGIVDSKYEVKANAKAVV